MLKKFGNALRGFRALSAGHKVVLLKAIACMPVFAFGLQVFGLARMQAVAKLQHHRTPHTMNPGDIRAWGELVNIAAKRGPVKASCLTRSLVLAWLLTGRGVQAAIRIGVRFNGGALDAHAWVECDGVPVNDKADVADQFAPFERSLGARDFGTQ
jgi:hypothetical protein